MNLFATRQGFQKFSPADYCLATVLRNGNQEPHTGTVKKCQCGNDVANNARVCPKCGQRFTSGSVQFLAWFFGVLIGVVILGVSLGGNGSRNQSQLSSASQPNPTATYVLPTEIKLDARAERGSEGEILIVGSTNLPDGMRLGVDILAGQKIEAQDWHLVVRNGLFRSAAFIKGKQLYPAGNHMVRFLSVFNGAWQIPQVLAIVGTGGKNLHGKLFKQTDPDVIDSDKELEQVRTINFPPFNPDPTWKAIHLVKTAVLTVPGLGRSATDIQENIALFMKAPGVAPEPGKDWSATKSSGNAYSVAFDFLDGGKPAQAIWSVDLSTGVVKYVNKSAKAFSWTPKD